MYINAVDGRHEQSAEQWKTNEEESCFHGLAVEPHPSGDGTEYHDDF